MLADDLSIVAATMPAERWLSETSDWPRRNEPPQAILAVASRLLALEQWRDGDALPPPRARVQTRSGQWLVLHASRLCGAAGSGQIAVILEPATPLEIAPLILQAYGLTEREARVAQLVLQGLPTSEIAASLLIAPLTVQQHLKAVFDKTGVHSRRELVAQVFARQYLPRMLARSSSERNLGATG